MKTKDPLPKRNSGTKRLSGILLGLTLSLATSSAAIAAPFVYLSNFSDPGSVAVVDAATGAVTPVAVGAVPWGVAVNPAGTFAYVANMMGDSVSVIDTTSKTVVATVAVAGMPIGIAVSADGATVYTANGDGSVAVINAVNNTLARTIRAGGGLGGIAVAGSTVYVTDTLSGNVVVIDTTTDAMKSVFVSFSLMGIAVGPSGVYVANIDVSGDHLQVSVIDPAPTAPTIVAAVRVSPLGAGGMPGGIALSGNRVYVAVESERGMAIIDTANNSVVCQPGMSPPCLVPVGADPFGVAVDPTGAFVFVANSGDGTVSVFNTATSALAAPLTVGGSSLVFGAFAGGAPVVTPPPPPTAPPTCEERLAELLTNGKQHHWGSHRAKYAQLKIALRVRRAAEKEIALAEQKAPGSPKLARAKKEFDKGKEALCNGRYWRATQEFWDAFDLAHRALRGYRHRH